ncbi:MAG: endonuclease Q family protein [Candidatus Komeilibacteria bacterium]|nr:endonuclease Q family protein [Candidatus Komeilibacteria bacterium]
MEYICDLHLHSKYARACSPDLTLANLDRVAKIKGINIVGTGDFSHPAHFKEIESRLVEAYPGLYKLKESSSGTLFMLTNEFSCIFGHGGKTRRLHICVWAPNLEFVRKLNQNLTARGCKLASDGRPIIGLSAKELLKICLEIDERHLTIPAHAWTPWFGLFGSKSGFNSLAECYEELSGNIYAIETGLSSDPAMNWQLSGLDNLALVSNSDAHSCKNLGREANVFDLTEPSFKEIYQLIKNMDKKKFLYTIEFFPEEGMYHFDGHRECQVSWSPEQTKKAKGLCPVCKKPVTVGVLNRVEELADRQPKEIVAKNFVPYKSLIPLSEIIADSFGVGKSSKKVEAQYSALTSAGKSEFNVLLNLNKAELLKITSPIIAEGIIRVREGKVKLIPGFDGQYGQIEIFSDKERNLNAQGKLF